MKLVLSASPLFISLICLACAQAISPQQSENEPPEVRHSASSKRTVDDCIRWDFHFLVTDEIEMSASSRHIEVFMEAAAFSENNLKRLLRHLSDKNPDTGSQRTLVILVKTDWKQLGLPNTDCPPFAMSGGDGGRDTYDYLWANFYRQDGREFFVYNPDTVNAKTKDVIIKGDKIFRNGAWQKPR
jgi:hypothetical protein